MCRRPAAPGHPARLVNRLDCEAAAAVAAAAMPGPATIHANQNTVVTSSPSPPVSAAPSPTPSLSKKAASIWVTEELPLPAGIRYASAETVDPAGRYIAGAGGDNRVVLWDNGSPALLPPCRAGYTTYRPLGQQQR
jgi:hypothetical protein